MPGKKLELVLLVFDSRAMRGIGVDAYARNKEMIAKRHDLKQYGLSGGFEQAFELDGRQLAELDVEKLLEEPFIKGVRRLVIEDL